MGNSVTRLFSLGDYKNIQITSEDPTEPLVLRLERLFNVQEDFIMYQIIQHELLDKDAEVWYNRLSRLKEIKEAHLTNLEKGDSE